MRLLEQYLTIQELRFNDRGSFELLSEHKAEAFLVSSFLARLGRENPLEHEIARYLGKIEGALGSLATPGSRP